MRHRLLKRQIRKLLPQEYWDDPKINGFLESVDNAYRDFDSDYNQLERTLELSSKESFKELSNFKDALNSAAIVTISDYKGRILFANDKFLAKTGFSKEEILGTDHKKLNSTKLKSSFYAKIWKHIAKGQVWKGDILSLKKDGSEYWASIVIVPLLNSIGATVRYLTIIQDITEERRAKEEIKEYARNLENKNKELDESQRFINGVAKSSPNIIFVYNLKERKNIYVNRDVFTELGYTQKQIEKLGKKIFGRLLHKDDAVKLKNFFNTIEQDPGDGNIVEFEYRLKDAKGHWQWFLDRTTVFNRDENGRPAELIGTSVNITKRKKVEEELIKAKKDAEKAAKVKADFLSNMSHEIRTPMNAIMGLTEILLDSDFKGQDKENLEAIKQSAVNLMVIINDILDFSRIDAGKVVLENISFNLPKRLQLIEKTIDTRAKKAGIDFSIQCPNSIPQLLIGDPFRLNQILLNFLSNAVKFTHKGIVKLVVSLEELVGDKISIRFAVSDTGIGISKDKLSSIFQSFTQANVYTTRKYGGTGLGLAISQKLTMLMGGKIDVSSEVGKGSTFTVVIPFKISDDSNKIVESARRQFDKSLNDIRVLVVEDQMINQMVIKQILNKWKTPHEIASDGEEAIKILAEKDFDIVCMDLQMPVMDGYEAARLIRTKKVNVRNHDIPIIALSADALPETRKRVLDAGMNDYLTKPPNLEELYEK